MHTPDRRNVRHHVGYVTGRVGHDVDGERGDGDGGDPEAVTDAPACWQVLEDLSREAASLASKAAVRCTPSSSTDSGFQIRFV